MNFPDILKIFFFDKIFLIRGCNFYSCATKGLQSINLAGLIEICFILIFDNTWFRLFIIFVAQESIIGSHSFLE